MHTQLLLSSHGLRPPCCTRFLTAVSDPEEPEATVLELETSGFICCLAARRPSNLTKTRGHDKRCRLPRLVLRAPGVPPSTTRPEPGTRHTPLWHRYVAQTDIFIRYPMYTSACAHTYTGYSSSRSLGGGGGGRRVRLRHSLSVRPSCSASLRSIHRRLSGSS